MGARRLMRSQRSNPLYSRKTAARLAGISMQLLEYCEEENLISYQIMRGGGWGLTPRDVRRLVRIRRLREDLGLNLPAVEVVIRMRQRLIDLLQQMDEMEEMMARREEQLMAEIRTLQRRFAEEIDWNSIGG